MFGGSGARGGGVELAWGGGHGGIGVVGECLVVVVVGKGSLGISLCQTIIKSMFCWFGPSPNSNCLQQ